MKHNTFLVIFSLFLLSGFTRCTSGEQSDKPVTAVKVPRKDSAAKPAPEAPKSPAVTYHPLVMKDSGSVKLKRDFTPAMRNVIYALNRVDAGTARRIDTLIIPDTLVEDIAFYSPFPAELPFLKGVKKVIYFSYPIQAFAAYEGGKLVRWGPTSMGKKATPTPAGLFFSNWKALVTHSTVKEEWVLKWNFNISNRGGVGWHLYAMPGYPASHSCLRLLEADARYLYDWADQWKLKGNDVVLANGTPAIVYGSYPWGQQRPWKRLMADPKANEITADQLQQETTGFMEKIMDAQQKRDGLVKPDTAVAVTP